MDLRVSSVLRDEWLAIIQQLDVLEPSSGYGQFPESIGGRTAATHTAAAVMTAQAAAQAALESGKARSSAEDKYKEEQKQLLESVQQQLNSVQQHQQEQQEQQQQQQLQRTLPLTPQGPPLLPPPQHRDSPHDQYSNFAAGSAPHTPMTALMSNVVATSTPAGHYAQSHGHVPGTVSVQEAMALADTQKADRRMREAKARMEGRADPASAAAEAAAASKAAAAEAAKSAAAAAAVLAAAEKLKAAESSAAHEPEGSKTAEQKAQDEVTSKISKIAELKAAAAGGKKKATVATSTSSSLAATPVRPDSESAVPITLVNGKLPNTPDRLYLAAKALSDANAKKGTVFKTADIATSTTASLTTTPTRPDVATLTTASLAATPTRPNVTASSALAKVDAGSNGFISKIRAASEKASADAKKKIEETRHRMKADAESARNQTANQVTQHARDVIEKMSSKARGPDAAAFAAPAVAARPVAEEYPEDDFIAAVAPPVPTTVTTTNNYYHGDNTAPGGNFVQHNNSAPQKALKGAAVGSPRPKRSALTSRAADVTAASTSSSTQTNSSKKSAASGVGGGGSRPKRTGLSFRPTDVAQATKAKSKAKVLSESLPESLNTAQIIAAVTAAVMASVPQAVAPALAAAVAPALAATPAAQPASALKKKATKARTKLTFSAAPAFSTAAASAALAASTAPTANGTDVAAASPSRATAAAATTPVTQPPQTTEGFDRVYCAGAVATPTAAKPEAGADANANANDNVHAESLAPGTPGTPETPEQTTGQSAAVGTPSGWSPPPAYGNAVTPTGTPKKATAASEPVNLVPNQEAQQLSTASAKDRVKARRAAADAKRLAANAERRAQIQERRVAADQKRRDEAERNAKSKAFIAKRDSKLNNKRFANEAQDQRRKAMLDARRQALADAKGADVAAASPSRRAFDGRAIAGAAPHGYDMTPRHVIQNDRPLSNQKPRKALSDEQMRKRREQIAARLSRKVDPAKLHAFAEAKETDALHIGRGGPAPKAKAKTKRSAASRTRRSTRTLARNSSKGVGSVLRTGTVMRPFPVADYYQANDSALSEADSQNELDLFKKLESDIEGEFDAGATFDAGNDKGAKVSTSGVTAAATSLRSAASASPKAIVGIASASESIAGTATQITTPPFRRSSPQISIMSTEASDTDEEHEDQLNASLGIVDNDVPAATMDACDVALGFGDSDDNNDKAIVDYGTAGDDNDGSHAGDGAANARSRSRSPDAKSPINLTFFAGGSSGPEKPHGVRRHFEKGGEVSGVSGFAFGDKSVDKSTYSRLELAATRQEAEMALAELNELKAQEEKARNERESADSTRAAAVLSELRVKKQQRVTFVEDTSTEAAPLSREALVPVHEQAAELEPVLESEPQTPNVAEESDAEEPETIAALTPKQTEVITEVIAEMQSVQQAAFDGVVSSNEQDIAALRAEHQRVLDSALADAAAARAEVAGFLEQQQLVAKTAAADAAAAATSVEDATVSSAGSTATGTAQAHNDGSSERGGFAAAAETPAQIQQRTQQANDQALKRAIAEVSQAASDEVAALALQHEQQQEERTQKLADGASLDTNVEEDALKQQQAEMAERVEAQVAKAAEEVERLKVLHAGREDDNTRLMEELESLKEGHAAKVERVGSEGAGLAQDAPGNISISITDETKGILESFPANTLSAEAERLEDYNLHLEESQKFAEIANLSAPFSPTAEDIAAAEAESPYMDVQPTFSGMESTEASTSEAEEGAFKSSIKKKKTKVHASEGESTEAEASEASEHIPIGQSSRQKKGKGKGKGNGKEPATPSTVDEVAAVSPMSPSTADHKERSGTISMSMNAQETPLKSHLVDASRRRLMHDPSREREIAELAAAAASKAVVAEFAAMEKVNNDRFDAAVAVLSASSGGKHSPADITDAASAAVDIALSSSAELNRSLNKLGRASTWQTEEESDVDILLAHLGVESRLALVRHTAKRALGLRLSFDSTILPNGVRVTAVSGAAAESGAIYVDDTIVEVNGISMMDASHSDIVEAIRRTTGNLQLLVVSADEMSKAYAPYAADDEDSDISGDEGGSNDNGPLFSGSQSLHWDEPYSDTDRPRASTDTKEREVIPAFGTMEGSTAGANEESELQAARELEAINIRRAAELEEIAALKARELEAEAKRLQDEHAKRTQELEQSNSLLVAGMEAKAKRAEMVAAAQFAAAAAAKESEVSELNVALAQKASAAESEVNLLKAKLELSASNKTEIERLRQEVAIANAREVEVDRLRNELDSAQKTVSEAEMRRHEDEMVRRKLHHQLQESKGNIRVVCRVRPLLGHERGGVQRDETGPVTCPSHADNKLLVREHYGTDRDRRPATYNFDKVFSPSSTQAAVFEEVSHVIQSALDGYNVCIFAYGQTSAGKTFTMEGGEDAASQGIIPRTVREVFKLAGEMSGKGWEYTVQTSFIEIYNDTIRDLLFEETADGKPEPKHAVFTDAATKQDLVSNLITETVTSDEQVFAQLRIANEKRASASTAMNARSSRSHSIFRIQMVGSNKRTGDSSTSTLNLVDLAGSERLTSMTPEHVAGGGVQKSDFDGRTATGTVAADRLRETQNINKSLAALSKVMLSLQKKSDHIPYRDCKLTHVLKNSLGGNSKSVMIVNISPQPRSIGETVCSLRFAGTVSSVEKGKLQRQATPKKKSLPVTPESIGGRGGGKSRIAHPSHLVRGHTSVRPSTPTPLSRSKAP